MTSFFDKQIPGREPLKRETGERFPGYGVQPHVSGGARMAGFLNVKEAALYLGVHVTTLATRAKAGAVPATKIGRKWLFSQRLLTIFIEEEMLKRVSDSKIASDWLCHSTNEKTLHTGGLSYQQLSENADHYRRALGLQTEKKPR
jgi:excisionase family DNA binding protein